MAKKDLNLSEYLQTRFIGMREFAAMYNLSEDTLYSLKVGRTKASKNHPIWDAIDDDCDILQSTLIKLHKQNDKKKQPI